MRKLEEMCKLEEMRKLEEMLKPTPSQTPSPMASLMRSQLELASTPPPSFPRSRGPADPKKRVAKITKEIFKYL